MRERWLHGIAFLQNNQQSRPPLRPHIQYITYACYLSMLQQHRLSSDAYILDGVKGIDARRRLLRMAEHVRQGS